jgi:hypothetical protein
LNPFNPVTSFQQPKEVTKKGRSLQKFLTAKNGLFLGRYECIPSSSTQMTSLSFAPRISHFFAETLKAGKAVAEPPKRYRRSRCFRFNFCSTLACMFANYQVNLVGQFTGSKLSLSSPGANTNDLLNLPDNWMKNIIGEQPFLLTIFWLLKKSKSDEKDFV